MADTMTILGLMSGTSLDGIDLAVLRTDGVDVLGDGPVDFIAYPTETRRALRRLLDEVQDRPTDILRDTAQWPESLLQAQDLVTAAHVAAVAQFRARHQVQLDYIGFHGQTICHRPQARFTLQIGDGAALAQRTGVPVIGQFRLADIAAGGQGAPLAPLYHAALARDMAPPVAVVNLGGLANITYLDGADILAFDSGPANALLDDWVAQHSQQTHDVDGALAAQGTIDETALAHLMRHPYFGAPPPKSLDRLAFDMAPVRHLSPADGAATLTAFTVDTVLAGIAQCPQAPRQIIVCGGGRHNRHLVQMMQQRGTAEVVKCDALGWLGDSLEAQAFAYLAARSLAGLPLSLPTTTGVDTPISGGQLYPV